VNEEQELRERIEGFYNDPYGHVMFSYPWDEKGTDLEGEDGPDVWQTEVLLEIGDIVSRGETVKIQVSSGNGVGKSCLMAWIINWFADTRVRGQGVATANTKPQLDSKTWREVAKWWKMSINKHRHKHTATKFYEVDNPEDWFVSAIAWNEDKPEAFAGTHDAAVLLIMDEASGIPSIIWEYAEGACTTKGTIWLAFGNPTRNTGRFAENMEGRFKHRWKTHKVDSRTAKKANQKEIQEWIEDYGEDSDYVRIHVKGELPRAGSSQLIPSDVITTCREFDAPFDLYAHMPVIIGVDPARFGDDESVICIRQGRKVHPMIGYRGLDGPALARMVIDQIKYYNAQWWCVDGVAVGSSPVDSLRLFGYGSGLIDVNMGGNADDKKQFYNRRAEAYVRLRDYLKAGADIPNDNELQVQLTAIEYMAATNDRQLQLKTKKDTKKDLNGKSPDRADALSLTFAEDLYEIQEEELEYLASMSLMGGGSGRCATTGY